MTSIPNFDCWLNGMKQMIIEVARVDRYTIVAIFLFLSNIFLNCFFGPHKNIEENKDMMLPIAVERVEESVRGTF